MLHKQSAKWHKHSGKCKCVLVSFSGVRMKSFNAVFPLISKIERGHTKSSDSQKTFYNCSGQVTNPDVIHIAKKIHLTIWNTWYFLTLRQLHCTQPGLFHVGSVFIKDCQCISWTHRPDQVREINIKIHLDIYYPCIFVIFCFPCMCVGPCVWIHACAALLVCMSPLFPYRVAFH